jgi:hypothetical protein
MPWGLSDVILLLRLVVPPHACPSPL